MNGSDCGVIERNGKIASYLAAIGSYPRISEYLRTKEYWSISETEMVCFQVTVDNSGARARRPVAPVAGGRGLLKFSPLTGIQVLFILMIFLHPRFYSSHS